MLLTFADILLERAHDGPSLTKLEMSQMAWTLRQIALDRPAQQPNLSNGEARK